MIQKASATFRSDKQKEANKEKYGIAFTPIFAMNGGLDFTSQAFELDERHWHDAKNVWLVDKDVETRPGYEQFVTTGVPLDGVIVGSEYFYSFDGTGYLFCWTTSNVYKYNTSSELWELYTYSTEVQDCEDKDDWTGSAEITLTDDTTNRMRGTNCLKVAVGAAFTTGIAAYDDFTSVSYAAYTHLHLWIKSSVATSAGDLQILLDDTSGCASPLETLDIPALVAGTLTEVEVALSDASLLTAVISAGINIATDLGAMNIYIDDIRVSVPFSGTYEELVDTEMFYNDTTGDLYFLSTNQKDSIQYFIPGTSTCWADLSGSPNKCRFMKNFKNHLMLFYVTDTNDYGIRIDWSVQGDCTDWSGSGSGQNYLIKTSDNLIGCEFLKGDLAIYKENSIAMCYYQGGTNPFSFEENKVQGRGALARETIQPLDDYNLFVGDDLYAYLFDGYTTKKVSEQLSDKFGDLLNPDKLTTIHSLLMEEFNLYLLFLPTTDSNYPNSVWVWNYKDNYWTYWKFEDDITFTGFYTNIEAVTIGDLTATIGNLNWRIGSRVLQNLFPFVLFGDKDGYTYRFDVSQYNDNGTAIDAFINLKSNIFNGVGQYSLHDGVSVYGKGDSVDVASSTDDGYSFKEHGTVTFSSKSYRENNFMRNLKVVSEKFMLRLHNNTLNERFSVSGYSVGHKEKDRIVT